jgi:phosphate starvation-inducible PhoH-like protein
MASGSEAVRRQVPRRPRRRAVPPVKERSHPVSSPSSGASTVEATTVERTGDTLTVRVTDPSIMPSLLGSGDEFLRVVEAAFAARIHARGNEITIATARRPIGAAVAGRTVDPTRDADHAARVIDELAVLVGRGQSLDRRTVEQTIRIVRDEVPERAADLLGEHLVTHRGRTIRPKTIGQKRYLDAIRQNTVTFGIGPAGTGKTYLAMGAAVRALRAREVNRLILTRPAVEAGERLGFLPGTLHEKIDPYLKPLWDALQDMMDPDELVSHVERGVIEVAPLAYMRGRTLNDAFVVLDEAQNTTPEQMKMFLTRIGFNARAVVTGDVSQTDLPSGRRSGLVVVRDILQNIEGVAFATFDAADVVRHPIVQRIVEAYEHHAALAEAAAEARADARRASEGTTSTED